MASGEDGAKRAFDNGIGADHDFADFGAQALLGLAEGLNLGFSAHGFGVNHGWIGMDTDFSPWGQSMVLYTYLKHDNTID